MNFSYFSLDKYVAESQKDKTYALHDQVVIFIAKIIQVQKLIQVRKGKNRSKYQADYHKENPKMKENFIYLTF